MISSEVFLLILVMLIVAFILAVYFVIKKELLIVFSTTNLEILKKEVKNILEEQGYQIQDHGQRIRVERGSITSANLYFQQKETEINVFAECSLGILGWLLLFVLFFWWTFGLGTIILAALFDYNSKRFAQKTLHPVLQQVNITSTNQGTD